MWMLLRCPVCHVRAYYNGRGQCSCRRAYLIHSFSGRKLDVPPNAYRWTPEPSGEYTAVYDSDTKESGSWRPIDAGLHQRPDARRRNSAP